MPLWALKKSGDYGTCFTYIRPLYIIFALKSYIYYGLYSRPYTEYVCIGVHEYNTIDLQCIFIY